MFFWEFTNKNICLITYLIFLEKTQNLHKIVIFEMQFFLCYSFSLKVLHSSLGSHVMLSLHVHFCCLVVPHITDAIRGWVERVAKIPVSDSGKIPQVCIVQLGGTTGDIDSMPFVEAFRKFQFQAKKENFCVAHVSFIPQVSVHNKSCRKRTWPATVGLWSHVHAPTKCYQGGSLSKAILPNLLTTCKFSQHAVFSFLF